MRPPRTVEELMVFLGRRQTSPNRNVPIQLPPPVPAPILLIQPGVTTRSIPGFGVSPTPPPKAPAPPPPAQSSSASSSALSSALSSVPSSAPTETPTGSAPARGSGGSGRPTNTNTSASTSSTTTSDNSPTQTSAPTDTGRGGVRPTPTPSQSPPSPLPEAGNVIPGLPSGSPSDTMTSGMMQPTDPAVSPDRGSANANSPEARGQQAGVGIAIFVAVGLVAGLIAMFCIRQANRKKAKKAAERAPTPDFISRPLARSDSNPWQRPLRLGSGGAGGPSGGNVAAAKRGDEWPMGAGNANRDSMENARYDENQQYAAVRPPPPVGVAGSSSRAQNGQAGYAGGAGMVGSSRSSRSSRSSSNGGGGNEQYTQYPISPASAAMIDPDRESLSKYQAIARINQHYAAAERLSRQQGSFGPIDTPSPLFFRPVANGQRPDSMTFGSGGGGQYGGAPPQQGRY